MAAAKAASRHRTYSEMKWKKNGKPPLFISLEISKCLLKKRNGEKEIAGKSMKKPHSMEQGARLRCAVSACVWVGGGRINMRERCERNIRQD